MHFPKTFRYNFFCNQCSLRFKTRIKISEIILRFDIIMILSQFRVNYSWSRIGCSVSISVRGRTALKYQTVQLFPNFSAGLRTGGQRQGSRHRVLLSDVRQQQKSYAQQTRNVLVEMAAI